MVSFKDFILVEDQKNFDVEKFYADCEPFIQKIRGIREEDLPKHGTRDRLYFAWDIIKVTTREEDEIHDIPFYLSYAFDDYFEKRFGWRARTQSILTTGNFKRAYWHGKGNVLLCFPIGRNFQTLWGEDVKDLFGWLLKFRKFQLTSSYIDSYVAEFKKVRWHYNEMIKEGYESGNEVFINADKVYLINALKHKREVINYLKSLKLIAA